jgi:hypothetical protein
MLRACPNERAWVLESRRDIADFWELVNPKLSERVLTKSGGER